MINYLRGIEHDFACWLIEHWPMLHRHVTDLTDRGFRDGFDRGHVEGSQDATEAMASHDTDRPLDMGRF